MRIVWIFALGLATSFLGTGCTVHADPTPGPAPVVVENGAPVYSIAAGAGVTLTPGSQAGYAVTAASGGGWRLVWTGDADVSGVARAFSGSVRTPGRFTDVEPGCADQSCPLESGDAVGAVEETSAGELIQFSGTATTGLDGLDFGVDADPVYFDLTVDGVRRADLVFLPGGAGVDAVPFGLTSG